MCYSKYMATEFPPQHDQINDYEPRFIDLPGLDVVSEAENVLTEADWRREQIALSRKNGWAPGVTSSIHPHLAPLDVKNLQPVTPEYEGSKRMQAIETLRLAVERLIPDSLEGDVAWQGDCVNESGDLYLLRREIYKDHVTYEIDIYEGYLARYFRDDVPADLGPSRSLVLTKGKEVKLFEDGRRVKANGYEMLAMAAEIVLSERD